jgi:hypothetical protein
MLSGRAMGRYWVVVVLRILGVEWIRRSWRRPWRYDRGSLGTCVRRCLDNVPLAPVAEKEVNQSTDEKESSDTATNSASDHGRGN